MILFFSGTGNSRRAAQLLADILQDQIEDAFPYLRRGQAPQLYSDAPWIFVSPTYAWRLPPVFETLLREGRFYGSKRAYFVMTCGDSAGNAASYLESLCDHMGLVFRGLLPVKMPENYVAMFPVPGEAQAKPILRRADKALRQAAEYIVRQQPFPVVETGWKDKLLSGPVNTFFHGVLVKDKAFFSTESCTGCGACVQLCPVNNIMLREGKPVWQGRCVHCMACICGCPQKAIEYGKKSVGKPRYQCPPWKGSAPAEGGSHDQEAL